MSARLALIFCLLVTSLVVRADAVRVVRIGTFDNPPIVLRNDDGTSTGLAIDVLREIARDHDWQLEFVYGPWKQLLPMLEQGQLDLVVGVAFTPSRAEKFDFSTQTLINNWGVVYVDPANRITSLADLQEKRVAVAAQAIHSQVFDRVMREFGFAYQPVPVASYADALDAVRTGRADAAVVNRVMSLTTAQHEKLAETGIIFNPVEVRYAGQKGRAAPLMAAIDDYLLRGKQDPGSSYQRLLADWLGKPTVRTLPGWLLPAATLAALSLLALMVSNRAIRHRIRQQNRELIESEQRFRQLAENIDDVFWVGSPDWQQLFYVSPGYERLWGQPTDTLYADPFAWLQSVHPDDVAGVEESISNKSTGADTSPAFPEYRIVRPNGEIRWVAARAYPVRDDDGNLIRIAGLASDVTDRHILANEIRESEERLRLALAASRQGLYDFDIKTGKAQVSTEYASMLGYDPVDFEENYDNWLSRMHPDDRAPVATAVERYLNGETNSFSVEFRMQKRGGDWCWIQSVGGLVERDELGQPVRMLGTHTDISDRKQVEHALRESESKFRTLAALSPVGVFLTDAQGGVVYVNERCAELVGLPADACLGEGWLRTVHDDDRQALNAARRRTISDGSRLALEHRFLHDDGKLVWVNAELAALRDENDAIAGFVGALVDITRLKAVELRLQRAQAELELRVADRTRELQIANQELEAFTYAVSHDLRAPLRAIQGFTSFLKADYADQLPEGAHEYLSEILTGVRRMGGLVDGLLELSRSTRGEVSCDRIDIGEIAREIWAQISAAEPERSVALEVRGSLLADGDPALVKTLLQNLLENAWKYTQYSSAPRVSISECEHNGERAFCIEDNGVGFDNDFKHKLFEPFQRLHHLSDFPGIGIGLATVQRIVRRHGGWVEGSGAPGQGAKFIFTLGPPRRAAA